MPLVMWVFLYLFCVLDKLNWTVLNDKSIKKHRPAHVFNQRLLNIYYKLSSAMGSEPDKALFISRKLEYVEYA